MRCLWIIPFLLLQDTEAFLMQNARAKQCLQASPTDGTLLLEGCDPASPLQAWSWQGASLVNAGTAQCLSVQDDGGVGTGGCARAGRTAWRCSGGLLSPAGRGQGYLVASRSGVALAEATGPRAQWRGAAGSSVCQEKGADAEHKGFVAVALASTRMQEPAAANGTLQLGLAPEHLDELLWFFRREDPSTWNYTMLALSFVVLLLGLFLLVTNVVRNRKRKVPVESEHAAQPAELEAKQALVPVQEFGRADPHKQELLPKEERSGEVLVQWKDGTVTTLYTERSEETL